MRTRTVDNTSVLLFLPAAGGYFIILLYDRKFEVINDLIVSNIYSSQ
jgi:hypothetical protein